MEILTAYPEKEEQLVALKAFLKALKIKFEGKESSPYDKRFVEKIKKADRNATEGNYFTIENTDNIWPSILSE